MPTHTTTPSRILAAAGDIFGTYGFKAATIRRIAREANANVAAINYHFGGKDGLYAAVLEDLFSAGFSKFPADMGLERNATPEQRLLAFIRSLLHRLLSREGWGGMTGPGRLIVKEFLEPTPSFEAVIEKYIKPQRLILAAILAELPGTEPAGEILNQCALSVIGQCLYYAVRTPVIRKLTEQESTDGDNLDQVAAFIWQFSLGGIERIRTNRSAAVTAYVSGSSPNI